MEKKEVDAYREIERKEMQNILDEYCQISREMGVQSFSSLFPCISIADLFFNCSWSLARDT